MLQLGHWDFGAGSSGVSFGFRVWGLGFRVWGLGYRVRLERFSAIAASVVLPSLRARSTRKLAASRPRSKLPYGSSACNSETFASMLGGSWYFRTQL